jgi:general secretion pathway protein A
MWPVLAEGIFFTEEAFEEIFNFSKGIPRLINIICDKALLAGYVLETKLIRGELINRCKREIEGNFEYEYNKRST